MRKLLLIVAIFYTCSGFANGSPWSVSLETGALWQARNDVRIPGAGGTRFSIAEIASAGPFSYYRLESTLDVGDKGQLRLLMAPFRYTESGVPGTDILFVDQTFNAGQQTDFTYQFNSYRVSYRYRYKDTPSWRLWLGGTVKIRDAKIALRQGAVSARDANVGVVPLFNLYSDYRLTPRWRLVTDFDGLVGPQGRALELGLRLLYAIDEHWYLGAGYRTLEGGADNEDVYNFAWFNYASVTVAYRH